ncbi:hypothetical protein ACFW04_011201 [Cataglyphis niger]
MAAQEENKIVEYIQQFFSHETEDLSNNYDNNSLKLNSQMFENILILEVQEMLYLWQRLDVKLYKIYI